MALAHAPLGDAPSPASMGPRSEDRGWLLHVEERRAAALRLQWGHDPKTVDGSKRCPGPISPPSASMGPRSEDRGWSRRSRAGRGSANTASMGPRSEDRGWAGGECHPLPRCARVASMGPRSEDRGWGPPKTPPTEGQRSASMGPRSEDRGWRPTQDARPPGRHPASMGPRSEDRGWTRCAAPRRCFIWWLQWGHDPKTVDGKPPERRR